MKNLQRRNFVRWTEIDSVWRNNVGGRCSLGVNDRNRVTEILQISLRSQIGICVPRVTLRRPTKRSLITPGWQASTATNTSVVLIPVDGFSVASGRRSIPRLGTNLISIITVIGHRSRGHVCTRCNRKLITAYPYEYDVPRRPQLSTLFAGNVNDSRRRSATIDRTRRRADPRSHDHAIIFSNVTLRTSPFWSRLARYTDLW